MKRTLFSSLVLSVVALFTLSGSAAAAASLTISPDTGLTNGQTVTVTGSGLTNNSIGGIVECNNDANQPTNSVEGNAVSVSCTNPLSNLATTTSNGSLSAKFKVITATVGPPTSGTDSIGNSAASDATKYPCPPTAAQIAAGDYCVITYGDANGDNVSQNISFASQSNTTTTTPTKPTNNQTPTSQAPASPLPNTGPGNIVAVFAVTAILATLTRYALYFVKK